MSFVAVAIGGAGLVTGVLGYEGAKSAANTQAQSANNALNFQRQVYADNQPRFAAATNAFANAQDNATNAFNTSTNAFNNSSAAFQPWVTTGQGANYTLSQLTGAKGSQPDYSSFFNSPDYQFAQQQGQRGVINAANAQGVGLSGGTLKDLSEFNSGLASQQYGNYFNRLMSLSSLGQNAATGQLNAATGLSTAATNYGNTSANIAGGLGNLATGAANSNNTMATNIGNTTQAVGQANASGIVGGTNAITGGINNGVSNSLLYNYLNNKNPSAYASNGGGTAGVINYGGQSWPSFGA